MDRYSRTCSSHVVTRRWAARSANAGANQRHNNEKEHRALRNEPLLAAQRAPELEARQLELRRAAAMFRGGGRRVWHLRARTKGTARKRCRALRNEPLLAAERTPESGFVQANVLSDARRHATPGSGPGCSLHLFFRELQPLRDHRYKRQPPTRTSGGEPCARVITYLLERL